MRTFGLVAAPALLLITAAAPLIGQQKQQLISQAALIAVVENHKGAVLRYIDAAPDSMLGFRPTKGVRTFAEQIAGNFQHVSTGVEIARKFVHCDKRPEGPS